MSQRIVLCEGFDDRAFWSGCLMHRFACKSGKGERDPQGKIASPGEFFFKTRTDAFVRLIPVHGKSQLVQRLRVYLNNQVTEPATDLVLCEDRDGTSPEQLLAESMLHEVTTIDPHAKMVSSNRIEAFRGNLRLHFIDLAQVEPPNDVHRSNTLDGLVCQAIARVYPERIPIVNDFLASTQPAVSLLAKAHTWSHMAGWQADAGCSQFFERLWKDVKIAREMERLLRAQGAWQAFEEVAR